MKKKRLKDTLNESNESVVISTKQTPANATFEPCSAEETPETNSRQIPLFCAPPPPLHGKLWEVKVHISDVSIGVVAVDAQEALALASNVVPKDQIRGIELVGWRVYVA
jgi:hypothetical protein